ncbi:hypothetical protein, partial [uncultured Algibacter sp.]|uniref:hypothetical protein n=1 Tax=uncultured Algibacter sp. TaxID=298659 RepID=UPI00260CBA9A
APALVINEVGDDTDNSSCDYADQVALNLAFQGFLDQFGESGGCRPQGSFADEYSAPVLCEGGTVVVTYNVTDTCDSGSETATFSVTAPAKIAVGTPPSDAMADSCTFANQG